MRGLLDSRDTFAPRITCSWAIQYETPCHSGFLTCTQGSLIGFLTQIAYEHEFYHYIYTSDYVCSRDQARHLPIEMSWFWRLAHRRLLIQLWCLFPGSAQLWWSVRLDGDVRCGHIGKPTPPVPNERWCFSMLCWPVEIGSTTNSSPVRIWLKLKEMSCQLSNSKSSTIWAPVCDKSAMHQGILIPPNCQVNFIRSE